MERVKHIRVFLYSPEEIHYSPYFLPAYFLLLRSQFCPGKEFSGCAAGRTIFCLNRHQNRVSRPIYTTEVEVIANKHLDFLLSSTTCGSFYLPDTGDAMCSALTAYFYLSIAYLPGTGEARFGVPSLHCLPGTGDAFSLAPPTLTLHHRSLTSSSLRDYDDVILPPGL